MTVRLTTLFLPGRESDAIDEHALATARPERFATLVQRNPFRVPPPEAVAVAPEPTPMPQPADERGAWMITGVVEGPNGVEVWLRHAASGRTRTIEVGTEMLGLTLVDASGDRVEFQERDERFVVQVGKNLNDRGDPDQ